MALVPIFSAIRIIPRDENYLDRKSGSRGEIYLDADNQTLRIYNGSTPGGAALARADLTNVTNSAFLEKATAAGVGSGSGSSGSISIAADDSTQKVIDAGEVLSILGGNGISTATDDEGALTINNTASTFGGIAVSGQPTVTATSGEDVVTFVAGAGITLTTNSATKELTITGSGEGVASNSFSNISVGGQNTVVADSAADTLTLVGTAGITITTNNGSDTITFTGPGNISNFSGLTDVQVASLTLDQIYLPAITMLNVTNNGASSYSFDQYGATANPTVYAINGTTIAFNLNTLAGNHPVLIQDFSGTNYSVGLIHVSTTGTVSTGADAQGKISGVLYWKIPSDISGSYRYQCSLHGGMVGVISIKNFVSI
jgi:plastocyanin